MSYEPVFAVPNASGTTGSLDDRQVSTRIRLLTQINPYMGDRLDALQTMATSDMDTNTLISTAGQHYAMIVSDTLATQLKTMSPASQRAVVGQLTPQQQAALQQMGYQPPGREQEQGLFGDIIAPVASAAKFIGSGVGEIPGVKAAASGALEGLVWVGNWPGHIYRTVRQLDDSSQAAGLIGAIAGIAAVALAIPTDGLSLMALGALGLGATAGAGAASFGAGLLTNPDDWMRSFNNSWDGEKTFDRPSRRKADALLADGRMRGLASDLAIRNLDLVDLAKEMAGQRDPSVNSQLHKIESIAAEMAAPGSDSYVAAVKAMVNAVQEPTFQRAVQSLIDGKMSPGRDFADVLGIDNNSTLYTMLSGGVDAVYTMAVDPTLMLGRANQLYKAKAYTMRVFEGPEAAKAFLDIAKKPAVLRYHTAVAEAVAKSEHGGLALMRSLNPSFGRSYTDLIEHAQGLVDTGKLASIDKFTVKDLHAYYTGWTNLQPVLSGIGTVASAQGIQLMSMGVTKAMFRDFRQFARALTSGWSDVRIEKYLVDKANEIHQGLLDALPARFSAAITEQGLIDKPWRLNQALPGVYEAGRAMANAPIVGRIVGKLGDVATALTTMALSGKAVAITGEHAARDIRGLSELGRYMGMPSWARQAWADAILSSDSPAARRLAVDGWMDNLLRLGGAYETDEGAALMAEYLQRSKQLYGKGDDLLRINGRDVHVGLLTSEQADMVVMPNMKELLRASQQSIIAKKTMGLVDLPIFETAINKIWKPMVLLRIGFIPRAAGEEMIAFMARGGLGSITQEFGGRFLGRIAAYEDASRKAQAGLKLTTDQQKLLEAGLMSLIPAHARPVVRMAARLGFKDPVEAKMLNYSKWLARHLETGLGYGNRAEDRIAKWAGQALDAPRNPADPRYIARPPLHAPNVRKLNVADYANSILLGNPYSVRRMLLGGVNDDMINAGRAWAEQHATTIMREVSAVEAGPIEQPFNSTDLVTRPIKGRDGVIRQQASHLIRGERRYVGAGDEGFKNGIHDAARRALDDPAVRRFLGSHLSRVKGGAKVSEQELGDAATVILNLGRRPEDARVIAPSDIAQHARTIVAELFDNFDAESWAAAMSRLRRSSSGRTIASMLDTYLPNKYVVSIDDIDAALRRGVEVVDDQRKIISKSLNELRRNAGGVGNRVEDVLLVGGTPGTALHTLAREHQQVQAELGQLNEILFALDDARPTLAWLEQLDQNSRSFAAQFLHQTAVGGEKSWWASNVERLRGIPSIEQAAPGVATHLLSTTTPSKNDQAFLKRVAARTETSRPLTTAQEQRLRNLAEDASRKATVPSAVQLPVSKKWLYDDLNDAALDIQSELRSGLMDPNMHDQGVIHAVRGLQLDREGQYVDTAHRSATVMLYEMPPIDGTFDDLVRFAPNPQILRDHRQLVERLIATQGHDAHLVANYELANEISKARTAAAGFDVTLAARPRMMRRARSVADGRVHGALRPDVESKVGKETQIWFYPRDAADARLMPTPDAAIDPIKTWTQDFFNHLGDSIGRGRKYTLRAKVRTGEPLADGTPTTQPLIYHYDAEGSGRLTPSGPGEPVPASMSNQLVDSMGRKITYGDTHYFEAEALHGTDVSGDVMWELIGPMARDSFDDIYGATRLTRKSATVQLGKYAPPVQSTDMVPVYRSKVSDLDRVPDDARPNLAVAQVEEFRKVGTFEKVVKYGFDNVIGGSLDALIRKPMAFHQFAQHFIANQKALEWTVDPVLVGKMTSLMNEWSSTVAGVSVDTERLATYARAVAQFDTEDVRAAQWSTNHALAWLRGHSQGELSDLLTRVASRAEGLTDPGARLAKAYGRQLARLDLNQLKAATAMGTDPRSFVAMIESKLPEGALRTRASIDHQLYHDTIKNDPLLAWLNARPNGWEEVIAMRDNFAHVDQLAGETAAQAAIADVVPFLDSHEFKTQFADYGKGLLPFWYAEENFMKRWARGLADQGPQMIRKMQLTYMGMKHAGIIRTDEGGKDWFVYPGSGLLSEAISKMTFGLMPVFDAGIMFQTPTDQMLPGMSSKIGAPSFNPFVTMPMEFITARMPELQPLERSLLGDFAAQRSVIEQIVPAHFRNIFNAIQGGDSSTRYASAQMSAIAYMEAHGQGLPESATAGQLNDYMDRVREHARIIVVAQALAGFTTPGSPSTIEGGSTASLGGIGITDLQDVLSDQYLTLVRMLGVEEGTAKFLEMNPDGTLDDIVNPLAYTTPRNVFVSGAPLPATQEALQFSIDNADYLNEFPDAAPWLLPQNYDKGARSQYAYDQQTVTGLRRRRTPEEYLRAMNFKTAASEYFPMRDEFLARIADAETAQDVQGARTIRADMDRTLLIYRVAHPVFREELESSDGSQRRRRTLNEMQSIIKDPLAPQSPQTDALRSAMEAFNDYRVRLGVLADNRTNIGRREIENLKLQFSEYMGTLVKANPGIMSFWTSVLRPEASLD